MMPTAFVIPATVPAWGPVVGLGPFAVLGALAVVATFLVLLLGILAERRDQSDFGRIARSADGARRDPVTLRRAA